MPGKEQDSRRAEDWFLFAVEDLDAAQALGTLHLRQASFLLQQAAEKALKGFLLSNGGKLRFTHDLELLLSDAAAIEPSLAKHEAACERVSLYYIQERYPGERRLSPSIEEFERIAPLIEAMVHELRDASKTQRDSGGPTQR